MTRRELLILSLLLPLAACSRRDEELPVSLMPVPIQAGDECAVCGMLIQHQPGPKGQLFLRGAQRPAKFCSTHDMFAYSLQPEYGDRVAQAYVHDMAATSWDTPNDDAFVSAFDAWYVVGHELRGGMGHTLAPFRHKSAAEAFSAEHGGRVLTYDAVTLAVLQEMNAVTPATHGGH